MPSWWDRALAIQNRHTPGASGSAQTRDEVIHEMWEREQALQRLCDLKDKCNIQLAKRGLELVFNRGFGTGNNLWGRWYVLDQKTGNVVCGDTDPRRIAQWIQGWTR